MPQVDLSPECLTRIQSLVPPHCRRVKIISLGDEGVGKSCIIKRHCEERFVTKYITTIGIDFGVKATEVQGRPVKVNFWDLAGNQEYFEIRNEFYGDAQGVLMVYAVDNAASFRRLERCWSEASQYGVAHGIPVAVCANKCDLPPKSHEVPEQQGRLFAQKHGFEFFATSANTGQNVLEMFTWLFSATCDFAQPTLQIAP